MRTTARNRAEVRGGRRPVLGACVLAGSLLAGLTACSDDAPPATGATSSPAEPAAPSATAGSGSPAGTSGPGSPSATTPSATASSSAPDAGAGPGAAPDEVVDISVRGRAVTPAPGRRTVSAGDRVRLVVTADADNVLHVHGAEVERELTAGRPLTVEFAIEDPGVYAVELHEPELLLMQLVVR